MEEVDEVNVFACYTHDVLSRCNLDTRTATAYSDPNVLHKPTARPYAARYAVQTFRFHTITTGRPQPGLPLAPPPQPAPPGSSAPDS